MNFWSCVNFPLTILHGFVSLYLKDGLYLNLYLKKKKGIFALKHTKQNISKHFQESSHGFAEKGLA